MVNLKENNLLVVTNAYPNLEMNFTQGIFIKNQVDSIKEEFNQLYVISPLPRDIGLLEKGKKCKNYSYDNIQVYYPKAFYMPKKYAGFDNIDFRLNKIEKISIELPKINLMHAHFGTIGKLISPLKEKFQIPFITSFYGYDAYQSIYNQDYYETLFDNLDFAIVLSDHMAKRLIELGAAPEQIKKVHIGIDLDKFKPIENLQRTSENVKILIVANFVEKKGIFNALYAFAALREKNSNTHLTILGRGPLKERIIELISNLKLENDVSIIDNYATINPRKTVLEYMQKCDIFLLPSIRDKSGDCEGTPVVLMEASSCEKPCVTTEHSGNPEIVIHNKTGFVASENNIEELTKYLDILVNDSNLRKEFGANGRQYMTLEFNKNRQSEKLIDIYRQLLK